MFTICLLLAIITYVISKGVLITHYTDPSCSKYFTTEWDLPTMSWYLVGECIIDINPEKYTTSTRVDVIANQNGTYTLQQTTWWDSGNCTHGDTEITWTRNFDYDKCVQVYNNEWGIYHSQDVPEKVTKYKGKKMLTEMYFMNDGKKCNRVASAFYRLLDICINVSVSPFHPDKIKRRCTMNKKEYIKEWFERYITDCIADPSDTQKSDVGVCEGNTIYYC